MSPRVDGVSLRARRVFQRLRVTPAPTWAIMTCRLLVQIIASLIMTVLIVGSIRSAAAMNALVPSESQ